MNGKILQLSLKSKTPDEPGLPKHPEMNIFVTKDGVIGDFNNYRHDHQKNTPDQALLIMPIEMIRQLNDEGWPIQPGDLGENITTEGISYNEFQPENRFKAGEIEFEITYACTPCHNLEFLPYIGKNTGTLFIKTMVGRRGWYAKVLTEGIIKKGDDIRKL